MKKTAEEILNEAIQLGYGKRAEGYTNNKYYINVDDLTVLLEAGAKKIKLNDKQLGEGMRVHEVIYKGHVFVSATPDECDFDNELNVLVKTVEKEYFKEHKISMKTAETLKRQFFKSLGIK